MTSSPAVRARVASARWLLALCLGIAPVLAAQSNPAAAPPQSHPSAASAPGGEAAAAAPAKAADQKGAQQAENQDENAQFRQSASIRGMARLLHISTNAAYWLAVVLNFAVVAVLVAWAVKKFVPGALRSRTAEIRRQMQEAQRASEQAAQRLREIESRLAQMGAEIAGLHSQAQAAQQGEAARMNRAAQEEAQRILRGAQQEIEAMAAGARRELRAFAAELTVNLAEKKIKIEPQSDRALVRDFTQRLGKDGN